MQCSKTQRLNWKQLVVKKKNEFLYPPFKPNKSISFPNIKDKHIAILTSSIANPFWRLTPLGEFLTQSNLLCSSIWVIKDSLIPYNQNKKHSNIFLTYYKNKVVFSNDAKDRISYVKSLSKYFEDVQYKYALKYKGVDIYDVLKRKYDFLINDFLLKVF